MIGRELNFQRREDFYHLQSFPQTCEPHRNFWNDFVTNQIQDETAEDNGRTEALISHDLTQNNKLAFSSTWNLQFHHFQILKFFFLYFRFGRIDMKDILRKSDVLIKIKKTGSVNQTQLDRTSERKKNEPITSNVFVSRTVQKVILVVCDWWFSICIFCSWENLITHDANLYHCKFSQFALTFRSIW